MKFLNKLLVLAKKAKALLAVASSLLFMFVVVVALFVAFVCKSVNYLVLVPVDFFCDTKYSVKFSKFIKDKVNMNFH